MDKLKEVIERALKLAKSKPDMTHFYRVDNDSFVSIDNYELDCYYDNEDDYDDMIDEIMSDDDNYIQLPSYVDDKSFNRFFCFS